MASEDLQSDVGGHPRRLDGRDICSYDRGVWMLLRKVTDGLLDIPGRAIVVAVESVLLLAYMAHTPVPVPISRTFYEQ